MVPNLRFGLLTAANLEIHPGIFRAVNSCNIAVTRLDGWQVGFFESVSLGVGGKRDFVYFFGGSDSLWFRRRSTSKVQLLAKSIHLLP